MHAAVCPPRAGLDGREGQRKVVTMSVKPKASEYVVGSTVVDRAEAPAQKRPRVLSRWSKRKTLLFIIASNLVGWTVVYLVLKSQ